ncbi:MAG: hypothetical protein JRL30_17120 [Deltaproteobacteria bacterium]|nr:hypothetical protein [Deltaproteobacteria bacterium]
MWLNVNQAADNVVHNLVTTWHETLREQFPEWHRKRYARTRREPELLPARPAGFELLPVVGERIRQAHDVIREMDTQGREDVANIARETFERGGLPAQLAFQLSWGAHSIARNILIMKAVTGAMPGGATRGVMTGTATQRHHQAVIGTVKHLIKAGAFTWLTSEGTPQDRTDAAMLTMGLMATPAWSSGYRHDWFTKVADIALNTTVTTGSGAYRQAYQEAQALARTNGETWGNLSRSEKASYMTMTMSTLLVTDVLYGLSTRSVTSKSASVRANAARQYQALTERNEALAAIDRDIVRPMQARLSQVKDADIAQSFEEALDQSVRLVAPTEGAPPRQVQPQIFGRQQAQRAPTPAAETRPSRMSVSQLRAEADRLNLSNKGTKSALVKRILEARQAGTPEDVAEHERGRAERDQLELLIEGMGEEMTRLPGTEPTGRAPAPEPTARPPAPERVDAPIERAPAPKPPAEPRVEPAPVRETAVPRAEPQPIEDMPPEQLSQAEWRDNPALRPEGITRRAFWRGAPGSTARAVNNAVDVAHGRLMQQAIKEGQPVNADAADALGVKVPDGWVREGGLYAPPARAASELSRTELTQEAERAGVSDKGLPTAVRNRVAETRRAPQLAEPEPDRPAQDVEARAAELRRSGSVQGPSSERLAKLSSWLRQKFTPTRGMGKQLWSRAREFERAQRGAKLIGRARGRAFQRTRRVLGKTFGRQVVNQALSDVMNGKMTAAAFNERFNLKGDNDMARWLNDYQAERATMRDELVKVMEETGQPPELINAVRENEYYGTRMYEAVALGEDFRPRADDYQAALRATEAGLSERLAGVGRRATQIQRKTGADILNYLRTGDVSKIANLTPTQREQIDDLGRDYRELSQAIDDAVLRGDEIHINVKAEALADAAQGIVDNMLRRQSRKAGEPGSIDISSLHKRHLQPIFRALFGEVTDPAIVAERTAANQRGILAHLTFFETLRREGDGKWWSKMASPARGLTERLGSSDSGTDRMKYGNLAGTFVSRELKAFLSGHATHSPLIQGYQSIKGMQRLLNLYGVRTIGRNAIQSVVGFALQNGDALQPSYWKNFGRATKLMGGVMKGNPDALMRMAELAEKGAFHTDASSLVDDIRMLSETMSPHLMRRALRKMGTIYAYIDMPAKVASYWTRLETNGGNERDAQEWVRRHYQDPESLPEVVREMSRWLGTGDYRSYFADAARMKFNGLRTAVKSGQEGDWRPAMGFLLSNALEAMTYSMLGQGIAQATRAAYDKLRGQDDVEDVEDADQDVALALRDFQPRYYQNVPQSVYWEDTADGRRLVYVITGGQTAFPMSDIVRGSWQASGGQTGDFIRRAGSEIISDTFQPGMLEESLYQAVTGDEMWWPGRRNRWQSTGPADLGEEHPNAARIIGESALGLGLDLFTGQYGNKIQQLRAMGRREARAEATGTDYTPRIDVADIGYSLFEPVRSYRVDGPTFRDSVVRRLQSYQGITRRTQGAISSRPDDASRYNAWYYAKLHELEGIIANARLINKEAEWYSEEEFNLDMRTALTSVVRLRQGEADIVLGLVINEETGKPYHIEDLAELEPRAARDLFDRGPRPQTGPRLRAEGERRQ